MTWIPLTATRDTTLEELLRENGLVSDSARLTDIWTADQNRENLRTTPRSPHQVVSGETWYVPPPPLPRDAILSTYTCTGSEASTAAIVETIKASHGEGADEQLTVAPDAFTESHLLGLAYNQAFRNRRSAGAAIAAGETLRFPTRRRRARTMNVAPSTDVQSSTNQIPTGDGPFIVTVALEREGQVLKVLDVLEEYRLVNGQDPNQHVNAEWRPADGKVRFKITIEPRAGEVDPTRVTIRVRKPDESVYYTEERTDWTTTGEHIWEWDGFTVPPPASGGAGHAGSGDVDTRVLRGQLTIEVVVVAASGWSLGSLELANRHAGAGWLDIHKHGTQIDGYAYLRFGHANEDEGLWAVTLLGSLLAAAVVAGLGVALPMAIDDLDGGMSDDTRDDYLVALGVTAGVTAAAWLAILIPIIMATRLSDSDFTTMKGHVEEGFRLHWLREGMKRVRIGADHYRFSAEVRASGGHDRIRFALTSDDISGRGCNLVPLVGAVFCPFLPGNESHNKYVGAHEFGHSIIIAAADLWWSMYHKGSTNLSSEANNTFQVPPSKERDLMIYYAPDTEGWHYDKMHSAPLDVLSWIALAQIEFKAV